MTDYTDHGDTGMTYCHKCQEIYRFGTTHTCPTYSQTSDLIIREKVANNLDILRKRAECDMLPAPIACSLIVEIQMYLEKLWGE